MDTTITGHSPQRAVKQSKVQYAGIYRYSLHALVTGGTPWDFVRLLVGIPLLLISFVLYLRGSLRGTVVFIGCLASFLYQYLLWTFDWAYNSLFLVYVALFSLNLWTLVLVLAGVDRAQIRAAIGERFPVRTVAGFSFAVGGLLLLKCLGEIVPGLGSSTMPTAATGYYTLVDQALDLGLLTPFCVLTGVLLLKRDCLGYLLSSSSLITLFSIGGQLESHQKFLSRENTSPFASGSLFLPPQSPTKPCAKPRTPRESAAGAAFQRFADIRIIAISSVATATSQKVSVSDSTQ